MCIRDSGCICLVERRIIRVQEDEHGPIGHIVENVGMLEHVLIKLLAKFNDLIGYFC